jgi:SAM-dependent methyltransferase
MGDGTRQFVVEQRVEAAGEQPDYSGREFSPEEVEAGAHRAFIGGVWDSHGRRQLDYLVGRGLQPHHRVLDIGCGPFRAGRHFVDYLEPGHYYGIDANRSLVQAGYDVELTAAQRERLPVTNLRANDRFDGDFGVLVDVAMAQSVFTHVSLNHIRLCLHRTAKVVRPGGSFYATFFERPSTTPVDTVIPSKKGKPFFTEKNVFWYYRDDLAWAASFGPWEYRYIGEWGHPAHQKMAQFVRLTDAQVAERAARTSAAQSPASWRPQVRQLVRRGRRWAAHHLDPG